MTTPTNESNEAYERRMAIKELMSAPQGTKFEECSLRINGGECWHTSIDPKWDFENRIYRIAPTPKKVLRKLSEIVAWSEEHMCAVDQGIIANSLLWDLNGLRVNAGYEKHEIHNANKMPDEWFMEASK